MKHFKTGLKFSPEPPLLRFGDFIKTAELPAVPPAFGHANLIGRNAWGMLGNDRIADCCIAGSMHAVVLWKAIARSSVVFTTADAKDDYRDACGYVFGNPATDQGGDMASVASYWRQTGVRDAANTRHRITAYVSVDPANLAHIDLGCYMFDAVGFGVELPVSAEQQFLDGEPWTVVDNDPIDSGHYIPYVQKVNDIRQVVTWGGLQDVTEAWLQKYLREVIVYLSPEYLVDGKSPLGFDAASLLDDLEEITA
jgi:hypothetical protein